jgi:hypothetical protein
MTVTRQNMGVFVLQKTRRLGDLGVPIRVGESSDDTYAA